MYYYLSTKNSLSQISELNDETANLNNYRKWQLLIFSIVNAMISESWQIVISRTLLSIMLADELDSTDFPLETATRKYGLETCCRKNISQ